MKRKTITIKDEQAEWITEKHINLSRLVQDKIDEELKKMNLEGLQSHASTSKVREE